jgi:hypothetical protein
MIDIKRRKIDYTARTTRMAGESKRQENKYRETSGLRVNRG